MRFYSGFLIAIVLLLPKLLFSMTNNEFISWWNSYRNNSEIPFEIKEMEDYFIHSGLIEYSSNYWNHLNKTNIEQISVYGYENFKQTVTKNYFTWLVSLDHPYIANLRKLFSDHLPVQLPYSEIHKQQSLFTYKESVQFNTNTAYLLNYLLKIGGGPFLEKLEEPLIGNPPYILYQNKRVSQDILNSLLEYLPISSHCPIEKMSTIIEVGAGSGRSAFCFIKLLDHVKYVIVDFPPALYLSQKYLSDVFPHKKIMRFRPFNDFKEVEEEYNTADIVFFMPNQLAKLPDQSADLFLAIDCLHEMKPDRIAFYFDQAERLCSYIYFKCWQHTTVPFDGVIYSSDSYPVHAGWQVLFKEPCVVPSDFFHAFYKMGF